MLMDQTSLSDLIAIYHLGAMVVGSSSGPMHLAAATGTPHVVWGGGRKDIRTRYVDEWNPLKTPVEFVDPRFHTKPAKLLDALDRMSAHPAVTSRDAAPVILQSERSQCL